MRREDEYVARGRVRELLLAEIVATRALLDRDGPPLDDGERDAALAWERALLAEAERLRLRDRRWARANRDPLRAVMATLRGRQWFIRRVRRQPLDSRSA